MQHPLEIPRFNVILSSVLRAFRIDENSPLHIPLLHLWNNILEMFSHGKQLPFWVSTPVSTGIQFVNYFHRSKTVILS